MTCQDRDMNTYKLQRLEDLEDRLDQIEKEKA